MSDTSKYDAALAGTMLFNELLENTLSSGLMTSEHPQAVEAIIAQHERMVAGAGEALPDYYGPTEDLSTLDTARIAEFYSDEENNQFGRLLRHIDKAVKYSAPLSRSHPDKGLREEMVCEDRHQMMRFLTDQNPHWLAAYNTSPEGQGRNERHALAIALGGHSIGAAPLGRLLAAAGETIDTMELLPNTDSATKAKLLEQAYEKFAEAYEFNPSSVLIREQTHDTPEGVVTKSRLSLWNPMEQCEEVREISTAPGAEPMSRSALIEAAAQSRWGRGETSDMTAAAIAGFSRKVLDYSLPEKDMVGSAGDHLNRQSLVLEQCLSRYAPAEYENWKQRDVTATQCVNVAPGGLASFLGRSGLSTGIGDTPYIAATPSGAVIPMMAQYHPTESMLLITQHGSNAGLESALQEDHPGAARHANRFEISGQKDPRKALVDHIKGKCDYLDADASEVLADLLTGELDPEDVPDTAQWVRDCYHRPSDDEMVMHAANTLLDGHGVEYVQPEDIGDGDEVSGIEYVNQGDPYVPTLVHFEGATYLAGQGDMVEAIEQRQEGERAGRDWSKMPISNPHEMPLALDGMIEKAADQRSADAGYNYASAPAM